MNLPMATVLARATSDEQDRMLHAEEPLAGLQMRCGGELPGTIAVPELLDLVRTVRRIKLPLGRTIRAQDGSDTIAAWIEAEPAGDGCAVQVKSWQTSPCMPEDGAAAEQRRATIDRHLAELSAFLDSRQRLLAASTASPELEPVAAAMERGTGQCWTTFLPPADMTCQQPLHWRLLDGIKVDVPGASRTWRVRLIPQARPGHEPSGFELLLLSETAPPEDSTGQAGMRPTHRRSLVGQDLAPVLKQPIARIVANAETIRTRLAGPLPDAYAEYAGEIAGAGKLLLGLLDDMADLEALEADDFSTAADFIELGEVARQAAGILGVRAREKNIAIRSPADNEVAPARAEFRRVLQILLNLIGNSIRYSPEGSGIDLTVEMDGACARAIVQDQGPGLSAAEQARVFDRFERLGRSGDGGSGLGLYISRRLARAMGGDLTVESAPGEGARFVLAVPAEPEG
ncbi:sensor histidine kinase [Novosphingobium panipatense]|uniref:histidine kinase n=3 Tax=Novosphingobium panipatense TaxID=428991 RepID=A0ABY1QLD2_9SPHN|nr:Histidine kinase-, DNA gyrase B-, and HSP90-like ATPase [Novosphingobium panipatense]